MKTDSDRSGFCRIPLCRWWRLALCVFGRGCGSYFSFQPVNGDLLYLQIDRRCVTTQSSWSTQSPQTTQMHRVRTILSQLSSSSVFR